MGICVIGTVFVDIKGYPLDTFVATGRNVGRIETVHGGVARNVAEDIANMELRPTFVGLVDDDGTGQEVISKLQRHKVDTRYMRQVPDSMGTWLAIFDNSGDVAASISKRSDLSAILDILTEQGDEIFSQADSIVLEIDVEKEIVSEVFALAEKHHKEVYALISNMNVALQRRDFIRRTACFVCNQQEAGILFVDDYAEKTPAELAEIIREKRRTFGVRRLVVTMGAQGAVYADEDGSSGIVPPHRVAVRDTTGAGDAFCAGLAAGLTYGKTLKEACEIGTTLAASVITSTDNVCPRFQPGELGL